MFHATLVAFEAKTSDSGLIARFGDGVEMRGDGLAVGAFVGVAGTGVGDGVGPTVGSWVGGAVGDGRLAVDVPETAVLGLAAGPPQAATRTVIRSAATG